MSPELVGFQLVLFLSISLGSTPLSLQGDNLNREIGDQGDSPQSEPLSQCLDILCDNTTHDSLMHIDTWDIVYSR